MNVIVGSNGSGKSNLVDAFLLMRTIVKHLPAQSPFAMWWGYENAVFMNDVSRDIIMKISGEIEGYDFTYDLEVNGSGGRLVFFKEVLSTDHDIIEREGTNLRINGKEVKDVLRLYQSILNHNFQFLNFNGDKNSQQKYQAILNTKDGDQITFEMNSRTIGLVLPRLLNDVQVLKVSPELASSPCPIFQSDTINLNGQGLTKVLFTMQQERGIPKLIQDFLEEEGYSLMLKLSDEGNIMLYLKQDNVVIPPPSLPHGIVKMLTILTALELKPSILVIDEVENSLHLKYLERLVDIIESQKETKVILTTHSPLLVDLIDPSQLIIMTKHGYSSKALTISNPEEVKDKLKESGILLSEQWLYGGFES
jgi:energy-coupling factor transporter ATP-binding protein EcfA2